MPFVTPVQLSRALEQLESVHPLVLFTVPAMSALEIPRVSTQGEADHTRQDETKPKYRGPEETAFLTKHFKLQGGPPGKPFFSPSGRQWVADDYATSSLQRQRKQRVGQLFFQSSDSFYPKESIADELAAENRFVPHDDQGNPIRIPLFAYASWLFRGTEVESPKHLIAKAKALLKLPEDLLNKVYDDSIPPEAPVDALGADPMSDGDLAEIVQAVPPPPPLGDDFSGLVSQIEASLQGENLILGEGLVARIVRAWAAQEIVILIGSGGTGKTSLANGIVHALKGLVPPDGTVGVPVEPDFSASDLIGYENLAEKFVDRPLTARILRSPNPLHPHVLVIEELNVTQVEAYLSPVLQAIESGAPIPLAGDENVHLPLDTLVLATGNSPRDEPETRVPMSGPTKRRATAIEMPNLLADAWEASGSDGVREVVKKILEREKVALQQRSDAGRGTWMDQARRGRLDAVQGVDDLNDGAGGVLIDLVGFLLENEEGKRWMTFGPLRDVLVQLVFAEHGAQPAALGDLVVGKVLPQVQTVELAQGIADQCKPLPNGDSIDRAVQEMIGPGGTVRALL